MTQTYKLVDLEEGTPVQYLGVYALKWRPEMGEPTVGFVEDDEAETLRARVAELERALLYYLIGDEKDVKAGFLDSVTSRPAYKAMINWWKDNHILGETP